jgi:hypothetical protein
MENNHLTDIQTEKVVKILDIANKLAKISPEYKSELYFLKHKILYYILTKKKHLLGDIIPMINNDNINQENHGRHRLLEVNIGDTVFHVPYHKKSTYEFNWTDDIVPIEYIKPDETEDQNNVLKYYNPLDILKDLFQIYVYICGGIKYIECGAIQYWYTIYTIRLLRDDQNLNLVSRGKGNNGNKDTEKQWIKYDLINSNGEVIESKEFSKYFKESKGYYNKYFNPTVQHINYICNKYE